MYLINQSLRIFKKNKIISLIIILQFFISFLLMPASLALLLDYNKQTKILQEAFANDIWTIDATVKNVQQYINQGKSLPDIWTDQQIQMISSEFPQSWGYIYIDLKKEKDVVNAPDYYVIRVSSSLFEYFQQAINKEAEYFFTDSYHSGIKTIEVNDQSIALSPNNKIKANLLKAFQIYIPSGSDFIILPEHHMDLSQIRKDNSLSIFLLNHQLSQIHSSGLLYRLLDINPAIKYELKSPATEVENIIASNKLVVKILLQFIVGILVIFGTVMIGFILVQYLRESARLNLFMILGARNKHIYVLYGLWNANLLFLPFIIATSVFLIIDKKFINSDYSTISILSSFGLLLLILGFSTLPLIKLTRRDRLKLTR